MVAWIALPREAWRQWCTNPLLLRQRRKLPYWAVAAALASMPVYRLWLLRFCAHNPWNWPTDRLRQARTLILDPYFVVAAVLIGWGYARTHLRSAELQTLPLSPRQRLWAIVMPAAVLLLIPMVVNAVRFPLGATPPPGYPARGLFAVLNSLATVPELSTSLVLYLVVGLAWHLPRHRGLMVSGAVLLNCGIGLAASFLWDWRLWMKISPHIPVHYHGHAAIGLQIAIGYPLAAVELGLLAAMLGYAVKVAEAEFFTPDAVEHWEAGRR